MKNGRLHEGRAWPEGGRGGLPGGQRRFADEDFEPNHVRNEANNMARSFLRKGVVLPAGHRLQNAKAQDGPPNPRAAVWAA